MNAESELPEEAWVVALLTLPGMGPGRLNALLEDRRAEAIWAQIVEGRPIALDRVSATTIDAWRSAARDVSVLQHWQAIHSLGIEIHARSSATYPDRLRRDIEPPEVLFGLGEGIPTGPTIGIVGTRNCTSYGQRCAFELGASLTGAGVSVVSGLALGIDAAAHRGALSVAGPTAAPPIGVVGSGLDIIYPRRNADLWSKVAARGALLSETPPGVGPSAWRFPARNRIIAGMSDAVIVIESHESGGSLITVDEAQLRDVPVGVVPGPITSNAASGSNQLLVDGATPVLGVDDALAMIGHHMPVTVDAVGPARASAVLDVLGWTPQLIDQLARQVTLSTSELAAEVETLVAEGLCARSGPWIERVR